MPCGDPVVAQAAHRGRELGLVRRHGAPLAGRDDLARVERQAGEQPERAARRPAVARPERARGVLDEDDVLRHGGLELLPGDRPAEEMDGEHGAGPARHRLRDELRSDEERFGIDVHEHRTCAAELDGVRGRGEGVGGDDHLVAGADAEREQREMDRGGSRRHADGLGRPDCPRERALERLDPRPHRQLAAGEHLRDGGELGIADVGPGEPDRRAAHAAAPSRARYHAIVRERPSSSSTSASKPSSDRALSTFGIRSSTSV